MATATYTHPTKLNAGKQRRLGTERGGESSISPRPIETQPLLAGMFAVSTTEKWAGAAKVLHIYGSSGDERYKDQIGWAVVQAADGRHIVRVDYMVRCKAPALALTLPAFQVGQYVEYKPAHLGRVERVCGDLVWVADEKKPYLAHQLTRLTPDPNVCTTCYRDGSMGQSRLDTFTHLANYECPACNGTGMRKW